MVWAVQLRDGVYPGQGQVCDSRLQLQRQRRPRGHLQLADSEVTDTPDPDLVHYVKANKNEHLNPIQRFTILLSPIILGKLFSTVLR